MNKRREKFSIAKLQRFFPQILIGPVVLASANILWGILFFVAAFALQRLGVRLRADAILLGSLYGSFAVMSYALIFHMLRNRSHPVLILGIAIPAKLAILIAVVVLLGREGFTATLSAIIGFMSLIPAGISVRRSAKTEKCF